MIGRLFCETRGLHPTLRYHDGFPTLAAGCIASGVSISIEMKRSYPLASQRIFKHELDVDERRPVDNSLAPTHTLFFFFFFNIYFDFANQHTADLADPRATRADARSLYVD